MTRSRLWSHSWPFAVALAWCSASAHAIDFIQDLARAYPTLFRNYQAMLPAEFADATWLYRLDGVTLSIDEGMMIDGTPFIRVYGCKPHACGDEQVALIFSTDGKIGAIKVRSAELTGGEAVFFGSDHPALRRIVDRDF
ncbi:hypothetical protein [Bradyrhizobium sp. LHD-71]|uniref:hypothetical protein n=1 Tax=Bradyrhizobium sp. LHD-71 TaxID=3072141 RepID=UPI0028106A0B|nr:hypothetical protein [Bradyrhizobium sp. LHD-71]MDQ8730189.1 hypothetical protein [Bradyrhizobium sp. LHD-71]